ncbi:PREDICTED: uncharacterized protein LOC108377289 isoform X1 [Rhagoletis zephyria]|uniref:uncharacterized protein LOC108377289 isoform X1 n=2 Tax=Rhagoletis zephyria TaxID=28612 RepID=UPI000811704B|nr:PREDICTED: uncharacterized protein LOC108377289 isoform X1 [Rhagoletis zephyria]
MFSYWGNRTKTQENEDANMNHSQSYKHNLGKNNNYITTKSLIKEANCEPQSTSAPQAAVQFDETEKSAWLTTLIDNVQPHSQIVHGDSNNSQNSSSCGNTMSPKTLYESSRNNSTEFQDFLQRIQTLKMSTTNVTTDLKIGDQLQPKHALGSKATEQIQQREYISKVDPLLEIEVGIEPAALMDCDEGSNEIAQIGSRIEQSLQQGQQSFSPNSYSSQNVSSNNNTAESDCNIRVTVGIDKDLEMILEMDPSIVDLGDIAVTEPVEPRVVGLPPSTGGPTFKTTVPKSRTQLKQQLQREQQQQELERREAEKRAAAAAEAAALQQQVESYITQQIPSPHQSQPLHSTTSNTQHMMGHSNNTGIGYRPASNSFGTNFNDVQMNQQNYITHPPSVTSSGTSSSPVMLKGPLQSIGVDVPKQVLQVRTVLENPTRYHVIQKQKNQVRQYLSESFKNEWENKTSLNSPIISNVSRDPNQANNYSGFTDIGGGGELNAAHSPQLRLTPSAATSMLDDPMQLSPSPYGVDGGGSNAATGGSCPFFLPNDQNSVKSFGTDSAYKNSVGGNSSSLTGGKSCLQSGRSSGPTNSLRTVNCSNVSTASPVQSAPMSPLSSVATSASEVSTNIDMYVFVILYVHTPICDVLCQTDQSFAQISME